jgi:5,10-methylenetetrahydrofolate reductase
VFNKTCSNNGVSLLPAKSAACAVYFQQTSAAVLPHLPAVSDQKRLWLSYLPGYLSYADTNFLAMLKVTALSY